MYSVLRRLREIEDRDESSRILASGQLFLYISGDDRTFPANNGFGARDQSAAACIRAFIQELAGFPTPSRQVKRNS